MRKLGIIGGVAWPSTIDYYKAICRLSLAHHRRKSITGPPPMPEMAIESLNMNKSFGLRGGAIDDEASWSRFDEYFRQALRRLETSGAALAIIASNTPHNRFDAITRGIGIPVLSIFDAVAAECMRLGVTKMLILGTAPTMDSPIFPQVLARHGVTGYAPGSAEIRAKVIALISELYEERNEDAAARIQAVVDASFPNAGALGAVCLACTELPLAFPQMENESEFVRGGVRYLNPTMIHARAAFSALLEPSDA